MTLTDAAPGTVVEQMLPRPYVILQTNRETWDTYTLQLAPADGSPCLRFRPGQITMMYVPGVGEVPISISSESSQTSAIRQTIRRFGSVTNAMANLMPGDIIGIRGPYGTPWPLEEVRERDVVVIAGGIGIAPLRSAVTEILEHRTSYGDLVVLYGARSPEDLVFLDDLQDWRARFDMQVEVTVDRAGRDWYGDVGLVIDLIKRGRFDRESAVAFICGPEVMMRFTAHQLIDEGMTRDRIYLTMERNMRCSIGLCGHCQFGPEFVCKDGPVFRYDRVSPLLRIREV